MEDLLKQILDKLNQMEETQKQMQLDIKDLKEGQNETNERLIRIESKVDDLEPKNATRHTEILDKIDTLSKDLALVEAVTGKNMADIASLKLVK